MLTTEQLATVCGHALFLLERDGTLRLDGVTNAIQGRLREERADFGVGPSDVRQALAGDGRFELIDAPSGRPDIVKWVRLAVSGPA